MSEKTLLIAMFAAFFWGFRHAVDWDHIAAITDITSTQRSSRSSLYLGSLYALGHSTVVGVLGVLAIIYGARVPGWLDMSMSYFVGITLILLGVYIVIGLLRMRKGGEILVKSRWWLLLNGLSYVYERCRAIITRQQMREPKKFFENYFPRTAYMIGAMHGIGAETPTQVLLFIGTAGVVGTYGGLLLLISFIVGMLLMNSVMIIASSYGFIGIEKNRHIYYGVLAGSAVFSLVVGVLFVSGLDQSLPPIFDDAASITNTSR